MNFAQFGKEKGYDKHPHLLDLHVARMVEAHRIALIYMRDTPILDYGMVYLENVLGADSAAEIAEEIGRTPAQDGRTPETTILNLPEDGPARRAAEVLWGAVKVVYRENVLKEVRRTFMLRTYLQHLINAPDDADDQKVFHSDTFFPALKFWYFPKAVRKDEGPFWYVPRSAGLSDGVIAWHEARVEDIKAGRVESWRGAGHLEGSFRISEEEITGLGLQALPVCVEADSLVIANVFGFHKRGDTKRPTRRLSIHGSIRLNPFPE